jgi:hypothetical protein
VLKAKKAEEELIEAEKQLKAGQATVERQLQGAMGKVAPGQKRESTTEGAEKQNENHKPQNGLDEKADDKRKRKSQGKCKDAVATDAGANEEGAQEEPKAKKMKKEPLKHGDEVYEKFAGMKLNEVKYGTLEENGDVKLVHTKDRYSLGLLRILKKGKALKGGSCSIVFSDKNGGSQHWDNMDQAIKTMTKIFDRIVAEDVKPEQCKGLITKANETIVAARICMWVFYVLWELPCRWVWDELKLQKKNVTF